MNNECYVFLGPSLSRSEATEILDAIYLPPAKQSDILSLVRNQQPKSIILIDGEFGQSLSVWHKEILYALDAGLTYMAQAVWEHYVLPNYINLVCMD